ncbi:hypothetical protein SMACR_06748 [Sordaria macrospora]|uniref:WGS project CABT00000000 data, contig 2.3 n=2 Tax=Sordaria macrospora TaxID=5147 RepID=F7VPW8_SORMK|nr:uncharacterized protein SMAC_06748 [Sordaria macrospora k-hell]KAA8631568.1 hypothetical protein SMACR_06748 [Sordaria macrospora]WPJ64940.1 hypothetical protein SMAC4_06748 [Sordaria macrospora]CCC07546.1 unnamed protein product [Sordaria macrospora k-hell]
MDHPRKNLKTKHDDRIILHFVFENKSPPLKSLPLGIRQKSLLATCNYPARRLGVKKLMSIASALAICPDLVVVDGEDLTPFRDVSKRIYSLLRSYSWNDKVERLGLDEVWMDVSDLVEYNLEFLNRNDLEHSWFCLDREDPEKGFVFDASRWAGCVYGSSSIGEGDTRDGEGGGERQQPELFLRTKLLLASHLAFHLRMKIEEEGYTTACGISTNKLLAKLVGNVNKPRNQTTLLSFGPDGCGEETVRKFMGSHQLCKIPGIGGKTASVLSEWFISQSGPGGPNLNLNPKDITVANLLSCPGLTPSKLDSLFSSSLGSGTALGTTTPGKHLLSLLQGHDPSPVKPARTLPTQISIEDTYHARPLTSLVQIRSELIKITSSLLKRMKTDLMDDSDDKQRWIARPKTLRLTTRPRVTPREGKGYGYLRVSKSGPLPGYVFGIANGNGDRGGDGDNTALAMAMAQQIVERLVMETLIPMFHQLNPINSKEKGAAKKGTGYSIGLLNVCVTNMDCVDLTASGGGGRDIKDMFMQAREFTVYDHDHDQYQHQHHHLVDSYDADADEKRIGPGAEPLETLDMDMDMDRDTGMDAAEDVDVDVDIKHHQHPDSVPDGYEQDSMLPISTTTIDYFHIEDDDEVWDDEEGSNVWENDEADEEELDYLRGAGGMSRGDGDGEDGDGTKCPLCNHFIPFFALSAHERFHSMESEGA